METYSKQVAAIVRIPGSAVSFDLSRIFVSESAAENAIEKVVPVTPQLTVLYLTHHPSLEGHPHKLQMYDTPRWEYYWSHIVNDVYKTENACQNCPKEGNSYRHQRHLKFPATFPLEFVAIDIAKPFWNSS